MERIQKMESKSRQLKLKIQQTQSFLFGIELASTKNHENQKHKRINPNTDNVNNAQYVITGNIGDI